METQNYQNHRKIKPEILSHKLYYILVIPFNLFAIANLIRAFYVGYGRIDAFLFVVTAISFVFAYTLFRPFALRAQDRAIRAEENLRHFALTGKLLDKSLTISQVIALRFAPDEEFIQLAERAEKEKLSNDAIKKEIKNWKADTYRV
jgi:hypothetical protein